MTYEICMNTPTDQSLIGGAYEEKRLVSSAEIWKYVAFI